MLVLRNIKPGDKKLFACWWRDKELLKRTSGILKRISDKEVDKYFRGIIKSKSDFHFIITFNGKSIGHVSLANRKNGWYETQIIIGNKKYWGKGYGSKAIVLLIRRAKRMGISKIYLEVRPTNNRAIRAYERCGFKKIEKVFYPKNKHLPETLRMELE